MEKQPPSPNGSRVTLSHKVGWKTVLQLLDQASGQTFLVTESMVSSAKNAACSVCIELQSLPCFT